MRTTITLDDQLARRVQDEMRARGTGFRQTLEDLLLRGLESGGSSQNRARVKVNAHPMVLRAGLDPIHLGDVETDLEVERFRKLTRRLEDGL